MSATSALAYAMPATSAPALRCLAPAPPVWRHSYRTTRDHHSNLGARKLRRARGRRDPLVLERRRLDTLLLALRANMALSQNLYIDYVRMRQKFAERRAMHEATMMVKVA